MQWKKFFLPKSVDQSAVHRITDTSFFLRCIYLRGRMTDRQRGRQEEEDREREKDNLHPLVHSPNGHNRRRLAIDGVWNSIWIAQMGSRAQILGSNFCLPRHISRSWIWGGAARTWTGAPVWYTGIAYGSLTHCATKPAPRKHLLTLGKQISHHHRGFQFRRVWVTWMVHWELSCP